MKGEGPWRWPCQAWLHSLHSLAGPTLGVLRWGRVNRQRGASWAIDPVPPHSSPPCPSLCLPHQCVSLYTPSRGSGLGLCVQSFLQPPHPTLTLGYTLELPSVQGPKPRLFESKSLAVGPKCWFFFLKLPGDSSVMLSWDESHWPKGMTANMYSLL